MTQFSIFNFVVCFFIMSSVNVFGQVNQNNPIKGILIYIDYPDAPMTVTTSQLDSLTNGLNYTEAGVNRSFRRYWLDETRGKYNITHDIFYYTAPQPSSFYLGQTWDQNLTMWRDALESIIANNPLYNWNQVTKWNPSDPYKLCDVQEFDGALRAISIIGSVYNVPGFGAAHTPGWFLSNGEQVASIQGSALQYPIDPFPNMFVFCHEAGHSIFNFPDTYDYDGSSGGLNYYSLMSGQGPDVPPVGAPFMVERNFGYIVEPTEGTHTITLRADGDSTIVVRNPHDENEFFSIQARNQNNIGNTTFPTNMGLLVFHTDLKAEGNQQEQATRYSHYKHSLIQPDGAMSLENSGCCPNRDAGDVFKPGDVFNDTVVADSKWWAGEDSGVVIEDIQFVGTNHVQFTLTIPNTTDPYSAIPKTNWSVVSAPPAVGGVASYMIDNDLTNYYLTTWTQALPHEIIIDLGEEYTLNEFYYTAAAATGGPWYSRAKDYELYISNDINNWGTSVAAEQFFDTKQRQYQLLNPTVGRYVKFQVNSLYFAGDQLSVGEIDFHGSRDTNIQLKAFLEGPYNTTTNEMTTALNANNLIPFVQPFNLAPHNYNGSEAIVGYPSADIVDWVLVQARDVNNFSTVIESRACFVLKDGTLMDIDGTVGVGFQTLDRNQNYRFAIYHKGHLGVLSSSSLAVPTVNTYDFTTSQSMAQGVQQTKPTGSVFALHAGDYDNNGIINSLDFNLWKSNSAIVNSYQHFDADLNAVVNSQDFNFWQINRSKVGEGSIQLP